MIVVNDRERQIGYLVFEDQELDVAEDLTVFLNDYCGWSCIC